MQQRLAFITVVWSLSVFSMACSQVLNGEAAGDGGSSFDTASSPPSGEEIFYYQNGNHPVEIVQLAGGVGESPRPVRIFGPKKGGPYPVIFFFHGYLCLANWYDTITSHLASHGFIVAAIQTIDRGLGLPVNTPKIPEETQRAVQTIEWLKENLGGLIDAEPDWKSIGYAGHSRGGKVAWNIVRTNPLLPVDAIAGVDPVDGTGVPAGTDIEVIKGTLSYDMPSLVIGTGLGPVVKSMMACAPKKDGHLHFWENVPSPAYHLVAEDFGHMEMLDDDANCGATCSSCAASRAGDRDGLRRQVGGSLVAFFLSALKGDSQSTKLLIHPEWAPVLITAESK